MQTHRWLGIIASVAGLLLIFGPHNLFEVCADHGHLLTLQNGMEVPMRCSWTAAAAQGLGGLILLMGLVQFFRKEGVLSLSPTLIGAGLLVFLLPLYVVPTCTKPEMTCNLELKVALFTIGAVLLVAAAVALGMGRRGPGRTAAQGG